MRFWVRFLLMALVLAPVSAHAECLLTPLRSWYQLVSANGYAGVVYDLQQRRLHHFREHIYATEEPRWNPDGTELWEDTDPGDGECYKPRSVYSRDLMHDAYFGVAARGESTWLTEVPVDMDASGYDGFAGRDRDGGTGIIRVVQPVDSMELRTTTRVFVPWGYESGAFIMAFEVENVGAEATGPISLYALSNTNLGFGRPGPRAEIGAQFETMGTRDGGRIVEQGFAGVIYASSLPAADITTHSPATFYDTVRDGLGDLPAPTESPVLGESLAAAWQWSVPDLAPGARTTVAVVVAHDPNPDNVDGLIANVDAWIAGRDALGVLDGERAAWATIADTLAVPPGLTEDETDLFYHSSTVLHMAQVRESSYWLRPNVNADPDIPRYTGIDGAVTPIAGAGEVREHLGRGAMLASLPPGEWAYAWVRDGAYAIVGLVDGGMHDEAREALAFFLRAEANRYVDFGELDGVPLDDYGLSLTRYHGFGIEESDTTCGGDLNFEWDGFGLFLWALRHYVEVTGDTSIVTEYWDLIRDRIANVAEGLVLPETGLMHADSSIWEVHWFGDEKTFAYTNIAGARGLCDAAALAQELGYTTEAERWDTSGRRLRQAIAEQMTTRSGALAANTEELASGTGYWDAAAVEGVGFGLFDPTGRIGAATLDAIRTNLTTPSGCGIFRNDDESNANGLTPYGSFYDSQEWIFLDYRVSMAARHAGRDAWADELQTWVHDQSHRNFLLIGENYDQNTGEYRNNAPMIGFGAGSYITAMHQRAGTWEIEPACGVYYEDDPEFGPRDEPGDDTGVDAGMDAGTDAGMDTGVDTGDDAGTDAGEDAGTDAQPDATPDTTPGEDTAPGEDTSPGEDTAPGEDTSPGEDTAPSEDTAPGDDTASGEDVIGRTDGGGGADAGRDGSDESSDDKGGCSAAGGSAGGWGGLALLGMLVRRRRRR